jgi:hypothetical protein
MHTFLRIKLVGNKNFTFSRIIITSLFIFSSKTTSVFLTCSNTTSNSFNVTSISLSSSVGVLIFIHLRSVTIIMARTFRNKCKMLYLGRDLDTPKLAW